MADTNLTKIDLYESTLNTIDTTTINENAQYNIKDMPIGGITNAQMLLALQSTKKGVFLVGSVYVCTDTVANQYTAGHSYKFTGHAWVDVTPEQTIKSLTLTSTTLSADELSTIQNYNVVLQSDVTLGSGTTLHAQTILTKPFSYSNTLRGLYIDNSKVGTYLIDTTTNVLGQGAQDIVLNGLAQINSKAIPSYPNDSNTYYLEYVNGTLTWVLKEDIIKQLPPFKSTIQLSVSSTSTSYTFPIVESTNFAVDWGDGTFESFSTATTSLTHTFATSGTIYVNFYGDWNGIQYTSSSNTSKNLIYGAWYDKNIVEIPAQAFRDCSNLEIFEYRAYRISIRQNAFRVSGGTGKLKTFDFSRVYSIEANAFIYQPLDGELALYHNNFGTNVVENLAFQYSYIKVLKVYGTAGTPLPLYYNKQFEGCSYLKKVILNNLTGISSNCFNYCSNLKTVIIEQCATFNNATQPPQLNGSLGDGLPSDLVILVPYSQLQVCKTATNWATYANQIYPIGGQYSEIVTIASADWTLNSQTNLYEATATVVGATNESRNILDWSLVDSNGVQIEDTYGLGAKSQGSMSITFTAQTVPTSSIYIFVNSTLTNYQE